MDRVAGLTGGIAAGKSTVAGFFRDLGASVIDADSVAREVVQPEKPAWRDIVAAFGADVLQADGELNRERLGAIVFSNESQRERLNRIVHPRVFDEMQQQAEAIRQNEPESLIIQDIPLLFETGNYAHLSPVVVVYVPEPVQLERLMRRDQTQRAQAMARIRAQMPIEEKRTLADIVIDNSGTLAETRHQVAAVFREIVLDKWR